MKHLFLILLLALPVGLLSAQDRSIGRPVVASAERRLALVIGMSEYQHVNRLQNPPNDADDMKATLGNLGFTVTLIKNRTKAQTDVAVNAFLNSLRLNDVVLFYFSGHGIGYQDDNYLLPTDARVECLEQIATYTLSAKRLMADFRGKQVNNSFVFLDACRSLDNLEVCQADQKTPTKPQGFVIPQNQPRGSILVYATQAGRTADDNVDARNGLFTQELLKYLSTPDLTLGDILSNTAEAVLAESLKKGRPQEPTVYGLLGLKFKFLTYPNRPDPNEETKKKDAEITRLKEELAKKYPTTITVTPPSGGRGAKFLDLPFADMVYVEGGSFEMGDTRNEGSSDEKPIHSVTVSSFLMGKYEVTQRQWREIMGSDPPELYNKNCDDCPVEGVSWNDIQEFLKKLNARTGAYRLPTEAEWEYAARGGRNWGDGYAYSGGNDLSVMGWFEVNYQSSKYGKQGTTHPVGGKTANQLGLYDMSGNVWEWCADWYGAYPRTAQTNPTGSAMGTNRVLRGGSWGDTPNRAQVAFRSYSTPGNRLTFCGFRLVSQAP